MKHMTGYKSPAGTQITLPWIESLIIIIIKIKLHLNHPDLIMNK